MRSETATDRVSDAVVWRRCEWGELARRDGSHLGAVERLARGRWRAFDAEGRSLGVHHGLATARAAVELPGEHRGAADEQQVRPWGPLVCIAAVAVWAAALLAPWLLVGR